MSLKVRSNSPFWGGPHIMGVVNVTPDSFSDGGNFFNKDKAIAHGLQLLEEGAHILDIGGESTRPGAEVVDIEEEIARVVPVIEGLAGKAPYISIDTRNAKTMEAALKAGANIVNDISALTHDPLSIKVAADAQVPVFLMHAQGTPQDMQRNPSYNNVIDDIYCYFERRLEELSLHRIEMERIVIDPGIGFGKTDKHNMLILRNIKKFHDFGVPLLLGTSRKSFISRLSRGEGVDERIGGSLASALWGLSQGVQIFRVHDVKETAQAFKIFSEIQKVDFEDRETSQQAAE